MDTQLSPRYHSSSKYEPGPSDGEVYTPSVSNDAEMHVCSPNHKADTNAGDWSAESDSDMSVDNRDNSEEVWSSMADGNHQRLNASIMHLIFDQQQWKVSSKT